MAAMGAKVKGMDRFHECKDTTDIILILWSNYETGQYKSDISNTLSREPLSANGASIKFPLYYADRSGIIGSGYWHRGK